MQPVEIEILDKEFNPYKILAYGITPTIAAHPRLSKLDFSTHEIYSITHIPSGAKFNALLVADDLTREDALKLAEYIASLIGEIEIKNHKDAAKAMLEKCPQLRDLVRAKLDEIRA